MENGITTELQKVKSDLVAELDKRIVDKIIEKTNADLLKKHIAQAETVNEAIMIAELGTTYKRTGFHFDKRLEKLTDTIKFFKKNKELSFAQDRNALTHKLIIGDNYDALLNLLIEYRGSVDVIYIDPPYSKDNMGKFAQTSYDNAITRDNLLSMLYPRLVLARQLLSDNGLIFCSIDDKNQAYVKGLFDEVFWESNFVANISIQGSANESNAGVMFQNVTEYLLCYAKNKSIAKINKIDAVSDDWRSLNDAPSGLSSRRQMGYTIYYNPGTKDVIPEIDYDVNGDFSNLENIYKDNNALLSLGYIAIRPKARNGIAWRWRWGAETLLDRKDELQFRQNRNGEWIVEFGQSGHNAPRDYQEFGTGTTELKNIFGGKEVFSKPKSTELIKWIIEVSTNKSSVILDFFAGSGTTGQAVLDINKLDTGKRRFILATHNEITDTTPNGIANDVTSKRLKRVMTGECYDGTADFKWNEKNKPLGDNLDVYNIVTVAPYSDDAFTEIDETLYGKEKLGVKEKIQWVCENFEGTQKTLENK